MARKSTLDKDKVITLFKNGMTYDEIAESLKATKEAVKKCLYRNAGDEVEKRKLDQRKEIISLYKKGLKFKDIEKLLNIDKEAIKKCIYTYAMDDVKKRKERKLPKRLYFLSSEDIKELRERKRYMIYDHETIGVLSFLKWNRQSYLTTKNGRLKFDRSRGVPTNDTPHTYNYEVIRR